MSRSICYALIVAGLVLAASSASAQVDADAGPECVIVHELTSDQTQPEPAPRDALGAILEAVRAGRWLVAVGGVLWLLVYLLRAEKLRALVPWLGTRLGGYAVAVGTPVLAAIAAALYAGEGVGAELVFGAIGAGFVAIGLHQGRKDAAGGA